jgi:hypothetical protein
MRGPYRPVYIRGTGERYMAQQLPGSRIWHLQLLFCFDCYPVSADEVLKEFHAVASSSYPLLATTVAASLEKHSLP